MSLAISLQGQEFLEGQACKRFSIVLCNDFVAIRQRRLLHEADDLHFHDEPVATEEEKDAEDDDEDDEAAFAALMVRGSNLTILKLNVSRVLRSLEFKFMLVKLKTLLLVSSLNSCI